MPHLILIKHSLPEIDPSRPAHEWPLSAQGRARCRELARQVAELSPAIVASSPEPKAVQTAQILAERLRLPMEVVEGLEEHDRRNAGWMSRGQFEASVQEFFRQPHKRVLGAESADEAHRRFKRALEGVLAGYAGQNIAVVAHGTVISLFVSRAAGIEPFPFWKRLGLPSFVVLSLPDFNVLNAVADLSLPVELKWDERGLITTVVQDAATNEVLMVAWMNAEALRLTRETGEAWFWSRSRRALWHKGATSGNVMRVRDIRADCDGDTLLLKVDPAGPACHTGERSCFFNDIALEPS
jgi:phosphoribosyl-AMP cyclohydrolase